MLSSYRDLLVWQKAMELAVKSYVLSHTFPKSPTPNSHPLKLC